MLDVISSFRFSLLVCVLILDWTHCQLMKMRKNQEESIKLLAISLKMGFKQKREKLAPKRDQMDLQNYIGNKGNVLLKLSVVD